MAITYDFDMFSIMPREIQAQFGDMFAEMGMTEAMKEQRALFRDPAAVAALQGASEDVKQCLIDSGFGINVYDSGAGPGRYPASDGPARAQVIERLMENLEKLPADTNWNGFDIEAFALAALNAKPLDTPTNSLGAMRATERAQGSNPAPASQASGMDQFFSSAPPVPRHPADATPNLDDFFSAPPKDARAHATAPDEGPDMDSFFSNTGAASGRAGTASRQMTQDDIRMSLDTTPPPKKFGFGPVRMGILAVGLYLVVSLLGSGEATEKVIELATGGRMVAVEN